MLFYSLFLQWVGTDHNQWWENDVTLKKKQSNYIIDVFIEFICKNHFSCLFQLFFKCKNIDEKDKMKSFCWRWDEIESSSIGWSILFGFLKIIMVENQTQNEMIFIKLCQM